jgi:hypothetical protein
MTDKIQINKIQFIGVFSVSIILGLRAVMEGVKISPDSGTYSSYADLLIKNNFNYLNFLAQTDFVTPIVLYSAWITIVGITKMIFGDSWNAAIVVLNYITVIYTLVLILKAIRAVTLKPACFIFALIAIIFCYEFHMWISYVLSDVMFASLCFSILFISLNFFRDPFDAQKWIISCLVLAIIATFFRPAFPPLLVFTFLSILFGFTFRPWVNDVKKRHSLIINLTFFAGIVLPAILLLHSYIILNPDKWPFPFFEGWIHQIAREYSLGIIVYGRPETFYPIPAGILDYFFMTISKLVFFFAIDFSGYSKVHAIINYIFFIPIYTLSAFSLAQLYRSKNELSQMKWWIIFSCFIFIVLFAIFHSCNQIDYDLRYRVPCLPPLVLMATIGLNELLEKFPPRWSIL